MPIACQVWGVINVTPDSFSDGGTCFEAGPAIAHGLRLVADGADVLDVGGEATSFHRPGVVPIAPDEQVRRVVPVIAGLRRQCDRPISIDTRSAAVARAALDAGASIVNDVSAGQDDPDLLVTAARAGSAVVLMHRGDHRPGVEPHYDDVVASVREFLVARAAVALGVGLPRAQVWVDPGLGFGKGVADNVALVRATPLLAGLTGRVLIGASRKRFVGAISGEQSADQRLGGSVAVALWAAHHGASAVRVHDVRATVQALRAWSALAR